ncbi:2-dehydro-3-deoxy-D-gluconate 5-dehydrogenase KduD [Arachidicoccus ginsenosidivorans]|uniref:2-dehydro-3-deoxy-D-gluconate 5-dehydrogenase KduD n=1 Tax=Arachidicoccus ginsenosidivorans TaxID=496057 RepID=A0A5B8VHR9_9BACT|nr:2-dehydro-3-deoxy-D-gluconate 5-dehydrogenase KduD [Arachidicoccus ginsenosidivorans]QEC70601.1 2-dehydro-3-deoxy-D-gluconate 5-dehydrogenase KduD [Arachidicoccus ginsenosidivorans]
MSINSNAFNLEGKTAIVTGSNRGIGQAMAIGLAEAGADIIGVSSSFPKASETQKVVESLGRKFSRYNADFSDRESVYAFIKEVKAQQPDIDILVNNAGTIMREPAATHPDDYWDKVISINLNAPFILAREFGKAMIDKGQGKIIFTCSMLSYQGGINVPGYTASKSGIAGLVKALANEWSAKGVQVNGIAPGYIATDNTKNLMADPIRSKAILERIPAGRWGAPEDLKGAVVFLASKAADYVSGTILNVDGGWMAR